MALSLAAGAATAFVAEQLDTSFHSADDLRAFTRVPVLVSIPLFVTPADGRAHQRRFRLAAVLAMGMVIVLGFGSLVGEDPCQT